MSDPLVIVGNGMAAACLCEELAQRALGRYAVAVIGEEPRLAYNRVLLSSVLAGEVRASDISLKPAAWWSDRGITLCYGVGVTAADIAARTVTLSDGKALPFAKLVFATGSRPICFRIARADLPGVLTFRDMSDVASMSRAACRSAPIVVIGGGPLGIEAAYRFAQGGGSGALGPLIDRLIERQPDRRAGARASRAPLRPRCTLSRQRERYQSQGLRRSCVLRRRFSRRARHRVGRAQRSGSRHLPKAGDCRRPRRRRRALRRYGRLVLVSRSHSFRRRDRFRPRGSHFRSSIGQAA